MVGAVGRCKPVVTADKRKIPYNFNLLFMENAKLLADCGSLARVTRK